MQISQKPSLFAKIRFCLQLLLYIGTCISHCQSQSVRFLEAALNLIYFYSLSLNEYQFILSGNIFFLNAKFWKTLELHF